MIIMMIMNYYNKTYIKSFTQHNILQTSKNIHVQYTDHLKSYAENTSQKQ